VNEARILINDGELKNIAATTFHKLTPILFANQGWMASSKRKRKK
jgi:hypothetical protein